MATLNYRWFDLQTVLDQHRLLREVDLPANQNNRMSLDFRALMDEILKLNARKFTSLDLLSSMST